MITVSFTANLQRHLDCPTQQIEASTVAGALKKVFADNARMAGYILDDQDRLRPNVAIFVDGQMVRDRQYLSDPLPADAVIYVMQALSGG